MNRFHFNIISLCNPLKAWVAKILEAKRSNRQADTPHWER